MFQHLPGLGSFRRPCWGVGVGGNTSLPENACVGSYLVEGKIFSNKIFNVTLVTQGLTSFLFPSCCVTTRQRKRLLLSHRYYSMSFNLSNVGGPYLSLKKKESKCMVFTSSRKREVRQFDFVVVQRRQEKRVMDVHSHRFAILTLLLFCRPCCFPYMHVWIHDHHNKKPLNLKPIRSCW